MNIVLLKSLNDDTDIITQQKHILKYSHFHTIGIDTTEIENSHPDDILEERKEFKGFLRSLDDNSHVIIFDLFTFSQKIDELVKVFECLLTRSITVHIASANIIIDNNTKPLVLLELLSKHRELLQKTEKEKIQGRPKGRMSKSKFDIYRHQIIELIESHTSISEISKILGVSRTSLKDYVNSRGLKDLVKAKTSLLNLRKKELLAPKTVKTKECSLIQEIYQTEGIQS